jgi:aminoglycoside 2''-phosphotransferase
VSEPTDYSQRIREIVPELAIEQIRLNRDGLLNDVVIVNEQFVFRFAKREFGFKDLLEEAELLRLVRPYLTLMIPEPFYASADTLAYPLIPGETLRREMLRNLAEEDRQALAEQLAQFFSELHSIPVGEITGGRIPMADALMKYEGWLDVYQRIREKVFPLLQPHQREWVGDHFEPYLSSQRNFEYELKLVDTDIPPYHILFDRQTRRISGLIDFGCAGLGDPAIDLGVIIYHYGESFLDRFYRVYPEAESYLKRARFYAGAHEVRWLLEGLERNETMWFAVHIGSAKDIRER